MSATDNPTQRYCKVCATQVHDVVGLSQWEIAILKYNAGENFCTRHTQGQVEKYARKLSPVARLSHKVMAGALIIAAMLTGNSVAAQSIDNGSYYIKQSPSEDSTITITGKLQEDVRAMFRKGIAGQVKVYNQDGLLIHSVDTDRKGRFSITLPKGVVGSTFTLQVDSEHYLSSSVSQVPARDTHIKVRLESGFIVLGRYF